MNLKFVIGVLMKGKKKMKEKIRKFLQVKEREEGLNDCIIFFCGMLVGVYVMTLVALLLMVL